MADAQIDPGIIETIQEMEQEILEFIPEAKFRLTPGSQPQFVTFNVFTPTGNMPMPADIMGRLDDMYRTHKVYVITVMYPLSLYTEEHEEQNG